MTQKEKQRILSLSKKWFENVLAKNHLKNTLKLEDLKHFHINPFLISYLSNFLTGNSEPESIARALVYPRVLGSSITTSFGQNLQTYISSALGAYGSVVSGIDIEFVDSIDGRKKYCQLKAGPNTINKDDIKTIVNHFKSVKNLARTNSLNVNTTDMVVGVLYGKYDDLSAHYKVINKEFPVYTGQDFWYRLTGDKEFYNELSEAFADVANEIDAKDKLEDVITKLSKTDEIKELSSILKR